jgi:hypothetical protein
MFNNFSFNERNILKKDIIYKTFIDKHSQIDIIVINIYF